MKPNLVEGQRIFINKISYKFGSPERGDIIVFNKPENKGGIPLIKRVIALPDERVEIKEGLVYINGTPLNETYIKTAPKYEFSEIRISEQHYFVLGDNRNVSRDSHYGWTVNESDIIGKAWISIWPPGEWGLVPGYAYSND